MKRIFIIFLLLLGSTALLGQIWTDGIIEYRTDARNMPHKIKPASSSFRNGEIWRPLNSYFYYKPDVLYMESSYRYDTTGILKQEEGDYVGGEFCSVVYNETFIKEGFDFCDTVTWYKKTEDTKIPYSREYYDYHYYDRFPEDSFYMAIYVERWNDVAKKWAPTYKEYTGYFDTTLFIIREFYMADFINGEWIKYNGGRILRKHNEDGLLTSQIIQVIPPEKSEYETLGRKEFVYDEDTIHVETLDYSYFGNDTWILTYKETDIQYAEWYPNCQPSIMQIIVGEFEYLPVFREKRAKISSFTSWWLNDNNEMEIFRKNNHKWDINGTNSHIDSVFLFYNNTWYLSDIYGYMYDEHGNYIQDSQEAFLFLDGILNGGRKYNYNTFYHPTYDYRESYYSWTQTYNNSTQKWDSTFYYLNEYFNWHDVTQPVSIAESAPSASAALFIFPNPVSGVVTIAASSEMQQLSIFDITGRLVASPSPAGERVMFDTGALPQGVYLVRALLRDGGVRTGKVVVR